MITNILEELNNRALGAYSANPALLAEHEGIETTVLAGGYGYRQILELIQNGADAILEDQHIHDAAGQISVVVNGDYLYVANTGAPISKEGISALLSSHTSTKHHNQIGRFGLGFKSLLKLKSNIEVFSKTLGSFIFDPNRCRSYLSDKFNLDGPEKAPALRLAWPMESTIFSRDAKMSELCSWAETVVRVQIRNKDDKDKLIKEIKNFPSQFLLFFPASAILELDTSDGPTRKLIIEKKEDNTVVLNDADKQTLWKVYDYELHIKDRRAIEDATHIHRRDVIPLSWALPMDQGRVEAGRFWAFFPTETPTYIPGILNAPWKMNADRNSIIGGEWNEEIMRQAGNLLVTNILSQFKPDDPGSVLDYFPRQLSNQSEVAKTLVDTIWKGILESKSIPNGYGELKSPIELKLHSVDDFEVVTDWFNLASDSIAIEYVHKSCYSETYRSSRLTIGLLEFVKRQSTNTGEVSQKLIEDVLPQVSFEEWISDIATKEIQHNKRLIKFINIIKKYNIINVDIYSVNFVLDKNLELRSVSSLLIFAKGIDVNGFYIVHPEIEKDEEVYNILSRTFGIKPLDSSTILNLLDTIFSSTNKRDHKINIIVWNYLHYLNTNEILMNSSWIMSNLYCKCLDNKWKSVNEALLPGAIFHQPYSNEVKQIVIDTEFHSDDIHIMELLGINDKPTRIGPIADIYSDYWYPKMYVLYRLYDEFTKRTPQRNLLKVKCDKFPYNVSLIAKTDGYINSVLSEYFIELVASGKVSSTATVEHENRNQYRPLEVRSPVFWFLLKYGTVNINGVAASLGYVYMRRNDQYIYDRLYHSEVYDFFDLIESEDIPNEFLQEHGDWSSNGSNTRKFWLSIFETYDQTDQFQDTDLSDLLHAMTECEVFPNKFYDGEVTYHISELYVTSSAQLANKVRPHLKNVLHLRSDLIDAWVGKGARKLEHFLSVMWDEGSYYGPDSVENTIPVILDVLNSEGRRLKVALVDNLHYAFEGNHIALSCLLRSDELLIDRSSNDSQSGRVDLYDNILGELDGSKLLNRSLNDARNTIININADKIIKKVAAIDEPVDKLLTLVGEDKNTLLSALPWGADQSHIQNLDLKSISRVVLTTLGPTLLQNIHIKEAMERQGLIVPSQWGTLNASNFVLSLGFPSEYAASKTGRRDPEEWVDGPFILPKLHDFQEEVYSGIKKLVESDQPRKRAVVSLPTGGGKTRVTVEAVIRLVMAPKPANNLIIWVAQTDELCEQAVVAFRQVWVNFGAQSKQLRLIRFWGGHQNPKPSSGNEDNPTVIVASIQTLYNRIDVDGTEWIREANVLVLDECHHAITSSYTKLLKWLDSDSTIRSVNIEKEPMIIGLSATPFRVDDDESERLANRFDRRWFPADQEHLYKKLIKDEVLSSAKQEALLSNVELTDIEIRRLAELSDNFSGLSLENLLNSINDRLSRDKKRNSLIVSKIKNSDANSILLFANSVQHATELAVRLTSQGVPAVAISGDTPKTARRYFLNQYQRGEIKVLCNFNVLTTGFDAPKTDMVLISRQIMSPVRYMQIVGRGLRGPKNGGTLNCKIVTVVDNFGRFGNKLAYHYCQQYFDNMEL